MSMITLKCSALAAGALLVLAFMPAAATAASSVWNSPRYFTSTPVFTPLVGTTSSGTGTVSWLASAEFSGTARLNVGTLVDSKMTARGTLGTVADGPLPYRHALDIDEAGRGASAWVTPAGTLQVRRLADGTWSAPITVASVPLDKNEYSTHSWLETRVAADGTTLVAWARANQLWARRIAADGTMSAASSQKCREYGPTMHIAISDTGDALLGCGHLVRTWSATAAMPTPAMRVWPVVRRSEERAEFADLELNAAGAGAMAWFDQQGRIRARTVNTAGKLGPVRVLTAPRHVAYGTDIDVDVAASGDALVVWSERGTQRDTLLARALRANGTAGKLVVLSRNAEPFEWEMSVAVDGSAAIAWRYGASMHHYALSLPSMKATGWGVMSTPPKTTAVFEARPRLAAFNGRGAHMVYPTTFGGRLAGMSTTVIEDTF